MTKIPDGAFLLASIPSETPLLPSQDGTGLNERAECILPKSLAEKTVFSGVKYPLPMPHPGGINYEIRPTPSMGLGMFAKRDLKRGELILAERPLLVVPTAPTAAQLFRRNVSNRDALLQLCFDRLTPENQAAYRALANSHTQDGSGPLHGILRTNGFSLPYGEQVDKCTAVYKVISRINHRCGVSFTRFPCIRLPRCKSSCRANASHKSAFSTFSCQLRAMFDIKKDEQIFISYCSISNPTPERQASFVHRGFQCTCASCTLPSFDDLYKKILERVVHLSKSFDEWVNNRSLPKDHLIKPALALFSLMEANCLHGENFYEVNLVTLMRSYSALGDLSNAMKYGNLCGMWYLYRESNPEIMEELKHPTAHLTHSTWGIRM
jgi:hypothetical protein